MQSKKSNRTIFDNERPSDPITIVTLHGKTEKYEDKMESSIKLPNVHFKIYGTHNKDVYV